MDRDSLIYLAAVVDNCSKLTIKKDRRTGSVYPYLRLKIKKWELREDLKQQFGGAIIGDYYIISHRKCAAFLDIIKDYLMVQKDKAEIILKLYSHGFSGKYKKEYKEQIYKKFERLEDGNRKRV